MTTPAMVETYKARARLQIAPELWREPGELVPEAHGWWRRESWLHAGKIAETTVSVEEFTAAIERYCPDQLQQLNDLAGVSEDIKLVGFAKMPVLKRARSTKANAKPAPAPAPAPVTAPPVTPPPAAPELIALRSPEGSGSE